MSKIPNGVPTITYCRLLPNTLSSGQGDIQGDGSNAIVILEPGQPTARYEIAQVLEKNLTDEEVCELTFGSRAGSNLGIALNPISAFVNDAANVVILLPGSKSTKKWQFLKRCLLPFIANEILITLSDRSQILSNTVYKAQLTLSACEFQDEVISDLLRPANRGLPIVNTLEDGVVIQGLHKESVMDEVSLRRLLAEGCENRGMHGLPVGAGIDTSAALFDFKLYQTEPINSNHNGGSGSGGGISGGVFQTQECISRLMIVDLPCIDPLASTGSTTSGSSEELRLLSGPNLHKSLFTFAEVVKKLSSPYRAQLAPFRGSQLTHCLSEALGGNALVVALGQIAPGEPQISRRTLDLLSGLHVAMHYPLGGREVAGALRGLLAKYRALAIQTQDCLSSLDQKTSKREEEQSHLIQKLQEEVADAIRRSGQAEEERQRIFAVSELLKAKYQTILEEKLKQSEELAQMEEDNLLLAREIAEEEVHHRETIQLLEKEKLDLNTNLLEAEARIQSFQLEMTNMQEQIQKDEEQIRKDEEQIHHIIEEKEKLQELLTIRNQELLDQKEKNIELGAELLTLVNQKEVIQRQAEEVILERDGLQIQQATQEAEVRKLLEKLVIKDDEIMELRKQTGVDSLQIEETLSSPRESQPTTTTMTTTMTEKTTAQQVQGDENGDQPNNQNNGDNNSNKSGHAIEAFRSVIDINKEKQWQREENQYKKRIYRLEDDLLSMKKERDTITEEVRQLRKRYRDLLERGFSSVRDLNTPLSPRNGNSNSKGKGIISDDELLGDSLFGESDLQSLLDTYRSRESILENELKQALTSRQEAILAYRNLYDNYKILIDGLEDMLIALNDGRYQDNESGRLIARIERLLENSLTEECNFSRSLLETSENQLNELEKLPHSVLEDGGQAVDHQEVEMKERTAAVIATFQRHLKQAEAKLAQSMQENVDLRIQIKQLLNPSRQSGGNGNGNGGIGGNGEVSNAALEKQFNIVYQNLTNEIQDLKKQLLSSRNREREKEILLAEKRLSNITTPPAIPPAGIMSSLGELSMPALNMNSFVGGKTAMSPPPSSTRRSQSIRDRSLAAGGVGVGVGAPESQQPQIVYVEKIVEKSSDNPALKAQLEQSEQRAAQLASRQITLEEELKAYQNYMKEILPQYQRLMKDKGKAGTKHHHHADSSAATSSSTTTTTAAAAQAANNKEVLKLPSLQR